MVLDLGMGYGLEWGLLCVVNVQIVNSQGIIYILT